MAAPVSLRIRHEVAERAADRCEYCGLPQQFALHAHEPDHIVPHQHGGESHPQNLAWACLRCNRFKGPNVGSFDPVTGRLVPLFNPRTQEWATHFAWEGVIIQPLTPEGRVTVTILHLNDTNRVAERQRLMAMGLYE
jgi:5-methylcytosine-specific restriction endonuclease McrA